MKIALIVAIIVVLIIGAYFIFKKDKEVIAETSAKTTVPHKNILPLSAETIKVTPVDVQTLIMKPAPLKQLPFAGANMFGFKAV